MNIIRSEQTKLLDFLTTPNKQTLEIIGINGPGGIGKTCLLNSTLEQFNLKSYKLLKLDLNGNQFNEQAKHPALVIAESLCPQRLPSPADEKTDYFPTVRRISKEITTHIQKVSKQIDAEDIAEDIKFLAKKIYGAGIFLNGVTPKTKEYINFTHKDLKDEEIDSSIDEALKILKTINKSKKLAPEPIRKFLGLSFSDRLKHAPHEFVVESFIKDTEAALVGAQGKNRLSFTSPQIPNIERLLLIIDDLEAFSSVFVEMVVSILCPALATARFETKLIIIGRDGLEATHSGFNHHNGKHISNEFHLKTFSKDEAMTLFKEAGFSEADAEQAYIDASGYPFLINLIIEQDTKGRSALFLKKFYERTTRWMTQEQKEALLSLCYLDEINTDTIQGMLPNSNANQIMNWFMNEASVRDPHSPTFAVNSFIRRQLLDYNKNYFGPSEHRKLQAKADNLVKSSH